jgi:thiamine-monophosphate kinase
MAAASGVRIELEHVPAHADARRLAARGGGDALDHALFDGEDYELIATLPRARAGELLARARRVCPQLALIGRVTRGSGVYAPASEGARELRKLDPKRGWSHGS